MYSNEYLRRLQLPEMLIADQAECFRNENVLAGRFQTTLHLHQAR